ncbi:mediator complex subunit 6 [Arctopsyche grandis]|uniref:mediator complex subunit 6 n=1 Tax=Arctopsyche grandis TaxID=121162 RepID=UPI00406D7A2A
MMAGRMGSSSIATDNPLGVSWHDSTWIPILNPTNVMDYFSQRSNPFFDLTCNNEIIKMQRLNPEQLNNMTGVEYVLLHVQEPILYVIRKQVRHSPTQTTPMADYYIIAGIIYQAPDLASVLNSRLLSSVHHLQSSFEETASYSRYHPSKGYSWDFKPNKPGIDRGGALRNNGTNQNNGTKEAVLAVPKEDPSTLFQRQRVDMLLAELVRQFPLPTTQPDTKPPNNITVKTENQSDRNQDIKPTENTNSANITIKQEPGEPNTTSTTNGITTVANGPSSGNSGQLDIKQEMKPPPEKKPRLI